MQGRPTFVPRVLGAAFLASTLLIAPAVDARGGGEAHKTQARANAAPTTALEFRAERKATAATNASSWCGAEFETMNDDVCYIDGRTNGPRRTLVIWLHGVIAKNTNWSWNHQRMLMRVAKYSGVEMLFPRGQSAGTLYAWPGTAESQEATEQELIDQWMTAKASLEKRDRRAFDEVFVFGF